MKKLLIGVVLASVASMSFAQWRHPHYEHRNNWVGPLIVGGIAGAIIARESQPVYVAPQPVYIQQQPVYLESAPIVRQQTICTEGKEIQTPDGRIYRERGCYQQ